MRTRLQTRSPSEGEGEMERTQTVMMMMATTLKNWEQSVSYASPTLGILYCCPVDICVSVLDVVSHDYKIQVICWGGEGQGVHEGDINISYVVNLMSSVPHSRQLAISV